MKQAAFAKAARLPSAELAILYQSYAAFWIVKKKWCILGLTYSYTQIIMYFFTALVAIEPECSWSVQSTPCDASAK